MGKETRDGGMEGWRDEYFIRPLSLVPCPFRSRGITLLETLVWVSIASMAMLAITTSVQYFYRTNTYAVEQSAAVTSGQRGVDNMIKTMREAAYSSTGAWPIISMSDTSFAFYADIDDDPFIEQIRFSLEGNDLVRGIIDPSGDPPVYTNPEVTSVISDKVRNTEQAVPVFRYYDLEGTLMTDLSKIAEVRFIEATVLDSSVAEPQIGSR
jgi:type II secretory pathway pseudopilin PulG